MRIGLLSPPRRYEDSFLHGADSLFEASGGNLGNFAFIEALCRHLSPDVILPYHAPPEQVRERCDLIVMAAANQLGPQADLGDLADHLQAVGLPVVAIGLGAQADDLDATVDLHYGTVRWLETMASLAPGKGPNIGVRGQFTLHALEDLGLADHAAITGCPSNFLNDSPDFYARLKRAAQKTRIDRLCVAAGSRHFERAAHVEARLARLVEATSGAYVAQADLDMVRFARGETDRSDAEERAAIRHFILPGRGKEECELWRMRYAMCFTDATSWMETMRNFDFAVGARFHGVMLAIQAGAPGGVVAHDSRTAELCQTMAIPFRDGAETPRDFALDDLRRLFPFDVSAYAAARERLRSAYVELLRGCGIAPSPRLVQPQAAP